MEEGADDECPFVVHGLTGESMINLMKMDLLKFGQEQLSILNKERFWELARKGLGGLENNAGYKRVSEERRKQQLLIAIFPLVAFNHEQIKNSTTAGYLLAERSKFTDIADRLLHLNNDTLTDLVKRLSEGPVKPETEEEKACFKIINDWIMSHIVSKEHLLVITFSPADINHPIALYFADKDEVFKPQFRSKDERFRLIANNPVAGARFFKMMVELFLTHVLE
ncbi:hypothetical protein A0H81_07001 [Grifola frondosa]|uniref:Helitron helicase-like domain-containing protein n=1 Tax=Grifola frondosa TaxID=5627 RepID=A0A1C7MCZ3_GRIFR|nr:hypothetical protein A0H81_07001 [Grifola frondosa]